MSATTTTSSTGLTSPVLDPTPSTSDATTIDPISAILGNLTSTVAYNATLNATVPYEPPLSEKKDWLIYLIVGLVVLAIAGIVSLILIWKFCSKKTKGGSRVSSGSTKIAPAPDATSNGQTKKVTFQQDEEKGEVPEGEMSEAKRSPLPPIRGAKSSIQSQETTYSTLSRGGSGNPNNRDPSAPPGDGQLNQGSYHYGVYVGGAGGAPATPAGRLAPISEEAMQRQLRDSKDLKTVPLIKVPAEKRRPLPPLGQLKMRIAHENLHV